MYKKGSMNTLCYYNIQYNADLLLDSVVRYSNDYRVLYLLGSSVYNQRE